MKEKIIDELIELCRRITDAEAGEETYDKRVAGPKEGGVDLRAVFESVDDIVFIKDLNRRYTMINPAGESLLGMPAGRIIGSADEELFDDRCLRVLAETDELALMGERVDFEHSATVGAKSRVLHTRKAPLIGPGGRVSGICGVSRDISDRRREEDELRRLNRAYLALAQCSRVLLRGGQGEELLGRLLKIIVDKGGYLSAWVCLVPVEGGRSLIRAAHCALKETCPGERCPLNAPRGPLQKALKTRKPVIIKEIQPPTAENACQAPRCRSLAALPLVSAALPLGVLAVCAEEPDSFSGEYQKLLMDLADDLAFALRSFGKG